MPCRAAWPLLATARRALEQTPRHQDHRITIVDARERDDLIPVRPRYFERTVGAVRKNVGTLCAQCKQMLRERKLDAAIGPNLRERGPIWLLPDRAQQRGAGGEVDRPAVV